MKYTLNTYTTNTPIFSGYYASMKECLEDAIIQEVDLSYVKLCNTDLTNTNLDGAHMPYASLTGANLTGSNLSEANLTNAQLYNASLYATCLCDSDLSGSDLRGAAFGATMVENTNLSECMFSTRSCFDLDFQSCKTLNKSLFLEFNGQEHAMSRPPVIVKGLLSSPIIILDHVIKIGLETFPKTILPVILNSKSLSERFINDNCASAAA